MSLSRYVYGILIGAAITGGVKSLTKPKFDLNDIVKQANAQAHVPVMVDPDIRLEGMRAVNNTMVLKYTLVNLPDSNMPYDMYKALKSGTTEDSCNAYRNDGSGMLVEHKVGQTTEYYNQSGKLLMSVHVDAGDCDLGGKTS